MDIVVAIAAVAAMFIGWAVLSGSYATNWKKPASMRSEEIETSIVELKKHFLAHGSHRGEIADRRALERLNALFDEVMNRHMRFVLDYEAQYSPPYGLFKPITERTLSGEEHTLYTLPSDFEPSEKSSEFLLYTSIFLWRGGNMKNIGTIDPDPGRMLEIVDYLIRDRQYAPALFLKGMIFKYGHLMTSKPMPHEAKIHLEQAYSAGVGSAAIELEYLSRYGIFIERDN